MNGKKQTVLSYIAPDEFVVKRVENRIHAMIIVGSFGAGKSTWTVSKIAQAIEERLFTRGIDDREILVVHAYETPISRIVAELGKSFDLHKIKYLYLFNDDAPAGKGMHGRRAMSLDNVTESQFYIMLRHRLKDLGFRGFIFAAHATQIYNIIDATFRKLAKLKVFKDYPEDPQDKKLIGLMLGKAYFRKLGEISVKIWSPLSEKDLIDGLELAVAKYMKYKSVVRAKKKSIPSNVEYITIYSNYVKNEKEEIIYKPPITFAEFAKIMRSHGIRAMQAKLLEAWHTLLDRLGYPVTVEDYVNA